MNERIQELKEQAWEYAMAVHDGHIVPPLDKEVWPMDKVFDEKFAELIVRECLGCCEQVISDPVPKSVDTWLNGGSQCIDEIKQHFGVEE